MQGGHGRRSAEELVRDRWISDADHRHCVHCAAAAWVVQSTSQVLSDGGHWAAGWVVQWAGVWVDHCAAGWVVHWSATWVVQSTCPVVDSELVQLVVPGG